MNTATTASSSDGTRLACWRMGVGAPLVLVHGGLCDHLAWHFVAPLLAEQFTVWTWDRRGHGQSGNTPPHTVAREVEDVRAVLATAGEPAHLLGHSAGAILALAAAEHIPSLLSLIVYDPPYVVEGARDRPSPAVLAEIERLLAAGDPDEALRIAMRETVALSDAEIDAMRASPGWEHLRGAARAIPGDWKIWEERFDPARLARIQTPTLVLLGEHSPDWIRAGTQAVAAALPRAKLATLEGQGHSAMIGTPELFARQVIRFAASLRSSD